MGSDESSLTSSALPTALGALCNAMAMTKKAMPKIKFWGFAILKLNNIKTPPVSCNIPATSKKADNMPFQDIFFILFDEFYYTR